MNIWNFNEMLTNNVFSFEQVGPGGYWMGALLLPT